MEPNSKILITGGTGSFGHAFVPAALQRLDPAKLIILSRDEMKQWEMARKFEGDTRLRFFIGDMRDRDRLNRALDGVDYVVHAAATKIVPTAEFNSFECIRTNVIGAMNLIDSCIDKGVKQVVALSTEKASSPANLYSAQPHYQTVKSGAAGAVTEWRWWTRSLTNGSCRTARRLA